jgi:hypothetical protein
MQANTTYCLLFIADVSVWEYACQADCCTLSIADLSFCCADVQASSREACTSQHAHHHATKPFPTRQGCGGMAPCIVWLETPLSLGQRHTYCRMSTLQHCLHLNLEVTGGCQEKEQKEITTNSNNKKKTAKKTKNAIP